MVEPARVRANLLLGAILTEYGEQPVTDLAELAYPPEQVQGDWLFPRA
jgi:hypothetical protein